MAWVGQEQEIKRGYCEGERGMGVGKVGGGGRVKLKLDDIITKCCAVSGGRVSLERIGVWKCSKDGTRTTYHAHK